VRRAAIALAVVVFGLTSSVNLRAAELAGVVLPDSVQAAGTTLVLNGIGLRTKFVVKVYVAGLYVVQKSSDADAILRTDAPKRLVMQFVRSVSKEQITNAFEESFRDNAPNAEKTLKGDIDRLLGAMEQVKEGDQMVFTYVPGAGTTFALRGNEKLTVAGAPFSQALFSVWLGPKPPTAALKKGLLGQ